MKVAIHIGHPAHVHLFRNLISILESKENEIIVLVTKKEMNIDLLELYKIKYSIIGESKKNIFSNIKRILLEDWNTFRLLRKFNPDILIGRAQPCLAHYSFISRKPFIAFSDTEHSLTAKYLAFPFAKLIVTPDSFRKKMGKKHIVFKGFYEQSYLDKRYYTPTEDINNLLNLKNNERYVILRFVSWKAHHDIGQDGLSDEFKIKLTSEFSKYAKVFITSERKLIAELEPYRISVSFDKIHDAINSCDLFLGESATMASEAAILGIPAIYIDDVGRGYTDSLENKFGLVYNYTSSKSDRYKALDKGIKILKDENSKNKYKKRHNNLISNTINVTEYMLNLIHKTFQKDER